MSTQGKWNIIHDGLVAGVRAVLGEDYCQQPDWFKDSATTL